MNTGPDLTISIVTFNSWTDVERCLHSVMATTTPEMVDVVVADNGSTDGTPDRVRDAFPAVKVIDVGWNSGFSFANNRVIDGAIGRHVLLLNPDTVVRPGSLETLIAFLDRTPAAGAVAPRLRYPNGDDQRTARSFPTPAAAVFGRRSPLTRVFPNNRWSQQYMSGSTHSDDEPFQVDWVSGACLMVPRRVVDAVGGLDQGFFMHWEDADWCHRIKDAGFEVWCDPTATVLHAEGTSRGGWPADQVRHFHRSAARYWTKHHSTGPGAIGKPLVHVALSARAESVVALAAIRKRFASTPRTQHTQKDT